MATTLLDQIRISSAVRQGAKYRTSGMAEWTITLKSREAATTARIVVLIDGTETEVDTANRNTRILRIIEQILLKENWEGRSVREQVRYALQRANKWLYDQAADAHKVGRLGASILVAIFTDRDGITVDLLYAGNCRAVLIRAGESYPLTVAHTRGADFAIKTGLPATANDQSLTRFLGAAPTLDIDTKVKAPATGGGQATDGSEFKLEFRDRLLLCSARVTPVAVEHFLPHMPSSSSGTIAQELVNSRVEPAVGNATSVVITRNGATRRLPYVAALIVLLALVGLFFLWPQIRRGVQQAWPETVDQLGMSPATLTVTSTLDPTPSLESIATVTPTKTATIVRTATAMPTARPTQTVAMTQVVATMPTATVTPTNTGLAPLITRPPTPTNTSTPMATRTPVATATSVPVPALTVTMTLTPIEMLTSEVMTTTEEPNVTVSVTNLKVEDFGNGSIKFSWASSIQLPANQGFVVVIAKRVDADLSDPNRAFGLHAPTRDNFVKLDINALAERAPDLFSTDITYFWGIRLERKSEDGAKYSPVPNQFWKASDPLMIARKSQSDQFGKGQ